MNNEQAHNHRQKGRSGTKLHSSFLILHPSLKLLLLLVLLSSCIRDDLEPCPPLSIHLSITDKNYTNVASVERATGLQLALPEDQPFRYYIQRLYYTLYNRDTEELITTRRLHDVQGDAAMATVYDIPANLPYGNYALVVWGNIDSDKGIMGNGGAYDLHQDRVEGYDVYHGLLTFTYDEYNADFICPLQRVKGNLLILAENLPEDVNWSRKAVTGVSGNVGYGLAYTEGDTETVVTERSWQAGQNNVNSQTYLAPTVTSKSTVYVRFFDSPEMQAPTGEPAPVDVQMSRNGITAIRYVYDPATGQFHIYLLVDDSWKVVHDMGIE